MGKEFQDIHIPAVEAAVREYERMVGWLMAADPIDFHPESDLFQKFEDEITTCPIHVGGSSKSEALSGPGKTGTCGDCPLSDLSIAGLAVCVSGEDEIELNELHNEHGSWNLDDALLCLTLHIVALKKFAKELYKPNVEKV